MQCLDLTKTIGVRFYVRPVMKLGMMNMTRGSQSYLI